MIYDYFRITGAHDTFLDYADLFTITLRNDYVQEFDTRWDDFPLSMTKIQSDDVLESLYKFRIRKSDQLKIVLELSDMETRQKISVPDFQKLKTMVKRSIDQKLRLRNFDARNERELKQQQWLRIARVNVVLKEDKEFAINGKRKGSVREEDKCSFGNDEDDAAKPTPHTAPPLSHKIEDVEVHRGTSPYGTFARQLCKDYLKGTCTKSPYDHWHPPECQFCKSETGCKFGTECSFPHWKVEEEPNKKPKKGGDKSAVAILKDARQLGCVLHDVEPPDLYRFYGRA